MEAYTIKDLENLSGIKAHTIRIWEQRYSFLKPQRTDTNIRYYSNDELKILLNISLLNKYGFKISHIDKMKPGEIHEKISSLTAPEASAERIINDLVHKMVDLEMEKFESVIDEFIQKRGVDRAINTIIFPFLEKIGVLWLTGHINPAQEHLISNIIRQKFIVAIDSCRPIFKKNSTALLFLPSGEHHEMGLLYLCYVLKSRGIKTIYIGANIPMADVAYITKAKKPDHIFVHLTATAPSFNLEKFLSGISGLPDAKSVIISGLLAQQYKKPLSGNNLILKRSMEDLMAYISTIQ